MISQEIEQPLTVSPEEAAEIAEEVQELIEAGDEHSAWERVRHLHPADIGIIMTSLPRTSLTRVCKIEIIATNRPHRPHRPWIPAYAGMTEWAPLDSGLRRNDGMGPIRNGPDSEHLGAVLYLSKPTLLCGLTFNCVKSQMKYIPLSARTSRDAIVRVMSPQTVAWVLRHRTDDIVE